MGTVSSIIAYSMVFLVNSVGCVSVNYHLIFFDTYEPVGYRPFPLIFWWRQVSLMTGFFFFFNILQLNSLLWAILRSTGGGLLRSLILGERAAVFTDRRTIPTIVALWYLFTTIYAKFLYHSNFWYYYWLGIWCTARTGSPKLSIFLLFRLNKIIFFKIKVLLLTQSVQGVVLPAIEALSKLRTITGGSDRANTVLGGKF